MKYKLIPNYRNVFRWEK